MIIIPQNIILELLVSMSRNLLGGDVVTVLCVVVLTSEDLSEKIIVSAVYV
jgi:hypothetical protein